MCKREVLAKWFAAPLLLALCAAPKASQVFDFQVYLDDKPIGEHNFNVAETGNGRRVSSTASFDVSFLFLNVYRYRHNSNEVCRNGCLHEIRATTDDNGDQYRVEGRADGNRFRLERRTGVEQIEGCLMTFAYWNRDFLENERLLNAQTGQLQAVRIRQQGADFVEVGNREVPATRYALTTEDLTIDLWYNDDLGWVGLAADTDQGHRLLYRRISPEARI